MEGCFPKAKTLSSSSLPATLASALHQEGPLEIAMNFILPKLPTKKQEQNKPESLEKHFFSAMRKKKKTVKSNRQKHGDEWSLRVPQAVSEAELEGQEILTARLRGPI